MSPRTTLELEDGIAWIAMDDGKVNAMSADMLEEIGSQLDAARDRAGAVVLSGREGIFSAGFDLAAFQRGPEATRRMVEAGVALIDRLLAYPRPVVAACTGHAYPMGAFLMLAADVRYGVAGDWNIGMNEVAIGIAVPRFAVELARHRLAPRGYARIPSGAMFSPDEALALGYLDYVVPEPQLGAAVRRAARELGGLDAPSYQLTKARINARVREDVARAWADHGLE